MDETIDLATNNSTRSLLAYDLDRIIDFRLDHDVRDISLLNNMDFAGMTENSIYEAVMEEIASNATMNTLRDETNSAVLKSVDEATRGNILRGTRTVTLGSTDSVINPALEDITSGEDVSYHTRNNRFRTNVDNAYATDIYTSNGVTKIVPRLGFTEVPIRAAVHLAVGEAMKDVK